MMNLMNNKLHTKWGTAKNYGGYWRINSKKEGNQNKYLHRLIWEDFYGCEVPEGYVVHHKDENPLNNCILNLQLMRREDHISLHTKGKKNLTTKKRNLENNPMWNEKTRRKLSKKMKGKRMGKDNPMWGKKRPDLTERNLKNNPMLGKKGEKHHNYRKDVPSGEKLLNELIEQNTNIYQLCIKYNCSYNTIKRRVNDAKSKK